ncbi:MAG: hypothetical protein ACK2UW_11810 [Anaerolineales bacterium]
MEKENVPRRRPFGLYVIIALQLIAAIFLTLVLLSEKTIAPYLEVLVQNPVYYSWFGWVLIGFLVLAVVGLLFLKRWGWILTMILTGLGLLYSILSYFLGNPHYLSMVIDLVIVFYLNQHDVQSAFLRTNTLGDAQ